jgi:hypothetical protein
MMANRRFLPRTGRFAYGLAAVALLLATARARAQAQHEGQLELALQTGVALPFGRVDAQVGDDLDQTVAGAAPFGLDIGYYVGSTWLLGAYGSYALALPASALRSDCSAHRLTCSTDQVRLGFQTQVHGGAARGWDPWVGLGSGYEWLLVHAGSAPLAVSGWEILRLDAGLDIRSQTAAPGAGPFVSWAMGEFELESTGGNGPAAIAHRKFHEWLTVGVRGVFEIAMTSSPRPASPPRQEPDWPR